MKHSKINNVSYLYSQHLLLVHSVIIDETGGLHGVRDKERLLGIIEHPRQAVFGKEICGTIFEKAAAYAFDIINYHPFVDGNKRSGMVSSSVFLELNGYVLEVEEGMIEKMAVAIVVEHHTIEIIAEWFEKWSKKIK